MRRFFRHAAELIEADRPPLAGKLRRASPHWMRHTHALARAQTSDERGLFIVQYCRKALIVM
jgi:hypothetical protein